MWLSSRHSPDKTLQSPKSFRRTACSQKRVRLLITNQPRRAFECGCQRPLRRAAATEILPLLRYSFHTPHCLQLFYLGLRFFHSPPWPPDFMSASSCSSTAKPARRCVRRSFLPTLRSCNVFQEQIANPCMGAIAKPARRCIRRSGLPTLRSCIILGAHRSVPPSCSHHVQGPKMAMVTQAAGELRRRQAITRSSEQSRENGSTTKILMPCASAISMIQLV